MVGTLVSRYLPRHLPSVPPSKLCPPRGPHLHPQLLPTPYTHTRPRSHPHLHLARERKPPGESNEQKAKLTSQPHQHHHHTKTPYLPALPYLAPELPSLSVCRAKLGIRPTLPTVGHLAGSKLSLAMHERVAKWCSVRVWSVSVWPGSRIWFHI